MAAPFGREVFPGTNPTAVQTFSRAAYTAEDVLFAVEVVSGNPALSMFERETMGRLASINNLYDREGNLVAAIEDTVTALTVDDNYIYLSQVHDNGDGTYLSRIYTLRWMDMRVVRYDTVYNGTGADATQIEYGLATDRGYHFYEIAGVGRILKCVRKTSPYPLVEQAEPDLSESPQMFCDGTHLYQVSGAVI